MEQSCSQKIAPIDTIYNIYNSTFNLLFQKCYPQINKSLQPQIAYKCSILDLLVMEKRRSDASVHYTLD